MLPAVTNFTPRSRRITANPLESQWFPARPWPANILARNGCRLSEITIDRSPGPRSPCQGEGRGFESRHPLEGAMASTPAVEWPSGEATACKAVHTGSIPVSTSENDPARLAQRESASLTRKRSLVQSQYRAPVSSQFRSRMRETQTTRVGYSWAIGMRQCRKSLVC